MISSITPGMMRGPISPVALGGAFVFVGQFVADKLLNRTEPKEPRPSALIYLAQKHFGWK